MTIAYALGTIDAATGKVRSFGGLNSLVGTFKLTGELSTYELTPPGFENVKEVLEKEYSKPTFEIVSHTFVISARTTTVSPGFALQPLSWNGAVLIRM